MLFKKEINPYPVMDKVTFRNLDKTLTLTVRSDGSSIVVGLKKANERLNGLTDETPEDERLDAARYFARTIFGQDQGDRLVDFYNGDALAIITACGVYFRERLAKKITKAQKK